MSFSARFGLSIVGFSGDCFDKQMYFIKIYYRTCINTYYELKSAEKKTRQTEQIASFMKKRVANGYLYFAVNLY